jgi:hypothetical protein
MPQRTRPDPADIEAKMRALIADAGLAAPDEVIHDLEHDELHFRWNTEKLVIIVELRDPPGPVAALQPPV